MNMEEANQKKDPQNIPEAQQPENGSNIVIPENPEEPETIEKPNYDWMKERVVNVFNDIIKTPDYHEGMRENRNKTNRKENIHIDSTNSTISIGTGGLDKDPNCDSFCTENQCAYNWETGEISVTTGNDTRIYPTKLKTMNPPISGKTDHNENIRQFAKLGNFLNRMKKEYVMNPDMKGMALQFSKNGVRGGSIEINDGSLYDTDVLTQDAVNDILGEYNNRNSREELKKVVQFLNGIKLDQNMITKDDLGGWTGDFTGYDRKGNKLKL